MGSKFSHLPEREGVTVIFEQETTVGGLDAFHQKWYDGGAAGDSLLFAESDVAQISDAELEAVVRSSSMTTADALVSLERNGGFLRADFNVRKV